MDEQTRKNIERHVAGAIVRHAGPYSDLQVPESSDYSDRGFIEQWVVPFYIARDPEFRKAYSKNRHFIDDTLITELLTFLNWRPRKVGALFAAVKQSEIHCDHIGRLLLRSDVCYAGQSYALALARFNTAPALDYLTKYLDHYLTQPQLYFDQAQAMSAVIYLDQINHTDVASKYTELWDQFTRDKPHWDLNRSSESFSKNMAFLSDLGD